MNLLNSMAIKHLITMNNYSVITICLNCEKTIKRAIDSVVSQTMPPKQYIFVCGDSKDKSSEIIASYRKDIEDKGVEFILIKEQKSKSEAGIPASWNLGIEEVTSDVVAILNADDFYPDKKLMSVVMEDFNKTEGCLIVSGGIYNIDNPSQVYMSRSELLFQVLNPYNHPATFIAKKLYDMIGTYDTSYHVSADYDFFYRAFSLGYKFLIDNEVIVAMGPGGFASQNKNIARYEAYKIASGYMKLNIIPIMAFISRWILRK